MKNPTKKEKVARNFIKSRGRTSFKRFLGLLEDQISGQSIAEEFGVSRERVRQWKNLFGETVSLYRIYPEVYTISRMMPRSDFSKT